MKKTLYVLLNKNYFKGNFDHKIDILTLNKYIFSEAERNNINNIYPNPFKTSLDSESLTLEIDQLKSYIIKKIKKSNSIDQIPELDELLNPFIEVKLSRYFYLESIIPEYQNYILFNKKDNFYTKSKTELIIRIEEIYLNDKTNYNDFFNKYAIFKPIFINDILLNIQKYFIQNIFQHDKKSLYFFSDRSAYFIESLKSKIIRKKNIIIYYCPTRSYLKIIKLLIEQLYIYVSKKENKNVGIFLLPENKPYNENLKIKKFFQNLNLQELNPKFSLYLKNQILAYILNTITHKEYILDLFRNIKFQNAYFHSVRFPDLFTFSRVINELKNNVSLISHGSHTFQNSKEADIIASKSMGIGLAYTNKRSINLLSQSIYCDQFLDSLKLRYFKINRIINQKSSIDKNYKKESESTKTKILLIGTVKALGARRYYFESSSEFLESVSIIYKKLKKYKDFVEVTLRIRDVKNEINQEILNNFLERKRDLMRIGISRNIYQEIKKCDCLISFSSTTLEEGLLMNKPVMCFGLSKYNHLVNYEKSNKKISKGNFKSNLQIIEKALGKNFVYKILNNREIDFEI